MREWNEGGEERQEVKEDFGKKQNGLMGRQYEKKKEIYTQNGVEKEEKNKKKRQINKGVSGKDQKKIIMIIIKSTRPDR